VAGKWYFTSPFLTTLHSNHVGQYPLSEIQWYASFRVYMSWQHRVGNNPDPGFKSRPRKWLSQQVFVGPLFPASAGIPPHVRPWPLPCTSFPVHLLTILFFSTLQSARNKYGKWLFSELSPRPILLCFSQCNNT
jgi:hypothetical protein